MCISAELVQLHSLVHCRTFKDPTDTYILHILSQPHIHANNRHTSYHFKDPLKYYDLGPNMSLIHFITDHMTEIRSAKAPLMPKQWAIFNITVRDRTAGHIRTCVQMDPNITCIPIIHFHLEVRRVTTILTFVFHQHPCFSSIKKVAIIIIQKYNSSYLLSEILTLISAMEQPKI